MGKSQEFLDAARKGDERTVEKIIAHITKRSGQWTTSLRKGPGVNVKDDNGYTPLHHACLHGHKEIVRLLLSVDASPCVVDKKGATPLHLAAFKGDSDVVAMLLAHNNPPVNVDQLTSDHETALLIAAHFGYVDVVGQLIAKGADVSVKNNNDESALDLAAQYGRSETVQHLLRVRPQLVEPYKLPQSRSWVYPSTPLHRASKNGRKEVVTALINAGVDPNIRTHNGTPLHEAACFGKSSVVRILLSTGADLDAVDSKGRTVLDLLADYSEEATRRVRRVIREFENMQRNTYESEEDLPPFPVPDYSPTGYQPGSVTKAPETQKNTNQNKSFLSSSSSSLTKNHSQSFVKKLASKCMGLKAKFNSVPNISNSPVVEADVDAKNKVLEHKTNTHTLLIGNSKFFKILSKKEESGEIICNDEFDTISLDRISALNRDSVINKSNRSCPGFKTSLPNISENNEFSDSEKSDAEFIIVERIVNSNAKALNINEAINPISSNIFEPRTASIRISMTSNTSGESENLVNECYEAYDFSKLSTKNNRNINSIPKPVPRLNVRISEETNPNSVYENIVVVNKNKPPTPAVRTHISEKSTSNTLKETALYENVSLIRKKKSSLSKKDFIFTSEINENKPRSISRASTVSSDSMIDESNLEDILLSQKSKSFRHSKNCEINSFSNKSLIRSKSNASDFSDMTDASAIENVDCSQDLEQNPYTSMVGTLPNKKINNPDKKHLLFRHKTFTTIDLDKKSYTSDLPKWNNEFLIETLAHYHIRGTGHCIYKAPTVTEFIYIFNRETLYKPVPPFTKVINTNRDSYFETAICFCKPKPPKYHSSAEDLLNVCSRDEEDKVSIDMNALNNMEEMELTSFRCYCYSKTCIFHSEKRDSGNLIVKFSAIKKSISTPNITLDSSFSTNGTSSLLKNNSIPSNLEQPYAVVDITNIVPKNNRVEDKNNDSSIYVPMSQHTTLSSSYTRYSIKDIEEVISQSDTSISTSAIPCASDCTVRKSGSSERSEKWSLQSCDSNVTIKSDASYITCFNDSSEESDDTLHTDEEVSDAETVTSEISGTITKRPWVHSHSFRFGNKKEINFGINAITEETNDSSSSKFESGISVRSSETSSSDSEEDDVPRASEVSLCTTASLERDSGVVGAVCSGSGRRRWDETEGTSEGDALSISSAASSCAPLHMTHHHEYSKVSPTPPKKPPRRNLSVSPTHANSPSSGYSYELRPHARSQDDLDDIQGSKHYLKHGRSVDQYVDGKLSYSEYEDNHSPRIVPVPNPRSSLKNRSQPVAITAMYENVVIKEQNPRRKLRRNNFAPPYENYEPRMNDNRVRKYSNQERSSLESLLDDQSMNSPSDCERYYDGQRVELPLSPTHYDQPPTPDHPPPSAKQAENSIHERIRPLSQLIMEVVEEIRVRKKSQGDITETNKNS